MRRFSILTIILVVSLAQIGTATAQDTCTVVNIDGDLVTAGSLGNCIQQANLPRPGTFDIVFNIDLPGGGPYTILAEQEYQITWPNLTIDGYSQPGALPNTNAAPQSLNTQLMVSVSGAASIGGIAVFAVETDNTVIQGLNVHSGPVFEVAIGLYTPSCQSNQISGCFIGTDVTGTIARPSGWAMFNEPVAVGVYLSNRASDNYIGGNLAAERNLISGESRDRWFSGHGILFFETPFDNFVIGNLIGTSIDPAQALPNIYGITFLRAASTNVVFGNVVSGNDLYGVWGGNLQGTVPAVSTGNYFAANYIGLDPNTNVAVPNQVDGVHMEYGCQDWVFSGVNINAEPIVYWGWANFISGNLDHGIYVAGDSTWDSSNNTFENNVIGLDTSGANPIPNGGDGIRIVGTQGTNFIGMPGIGNLISGNVGNGINLIASSNNAMHDNWIGRNFVGDTAQPNELDGIRLRCTDAACSDGNFIASSHITSNLGDGIFLWGPVADNTIFANNLIEHNQLTGIYAYQADSSNLVTSTTVFQNTSHGIELAGSSLTIDDNAIIGNGSWGIAVLPLYNGTYSPATAADDMISEPDITANTIDGNQSGGIRSQDTEPVNGTTLHTDNTIGDNNNLLDVWQIWFSAVEILDSGGSPIGSGAYTITQENAWGGVSTISTPEGNLWGDAGFDADDVRTWLGLTAYYVNSAGDFIEANPRIVRVTGPTGGTDSYSYDGVDNDLEEGGQPAGIDTGGQFRYQIADVITDLDSDDDAVADSDDCAPYDPNYQGGPWGVTCDADSDGYCDDAINGDVQESACPNEVCVSGMCTPSDCDDSNDAINPGVTEGPFGDATCADTDDNDCDTFTDNADPDCFECFSDDDCSDNDVCNGIETCVANFCAAGAILVCNDNNVCTDDSCDPSTGCQFDFNTDSCDDGLYCTVSDTCDGAGT
ncbi:MAG: right-handed parallel beta-helix repeat-containing protein, partial [Deltaproteobacteria bacterium]|nr:right-handed parallel beta-helix repeat-containing protein [Deltaproteobacteria bacterium]